MGVQIKNKSYSIFRHQNMTFRIIVSQLSITQVSLRYTNFISFSALRFQLIYRHCRLPYHSVLLITVTFTKRSIYIIRFDLLIFHLHRNDPIIIRPSARFKHFQTLSSTVLRACSGRRSSFLL